MDDFLQKWQAYSLTFWPKYGVLGTFQFVLENEESWKLTIFGKNGKPIALIFGQNMVLLGTFHFTLHLDQIEMRLISAKIPNL